MGSNLKFVFRRHCSGSHSVDINNKGVTPSYRPCLVREVSRLYMATRLPSRLVLRVRPALPHQTANVSPPN